MVQVIAGRVGLPTAAIDPFAHGGMIRLERLEAAHVLALAGATSLAYGQPLPPSGALQEAKNALADLDGDAVFFGNGRWEAGSPQSWNPATTATFDCGVIGFDDACAFVFWVEEED